MSQKIIVNSHNVAQDGFITAGGMCGRDISANILTHATSSGMSFIMCAMLNRVFYIKKGRK